MIISGCDYISERDFDEVWGAHANLNGDLYFYEEVRSLPIQYVWTVSEGEDLDESGFNLDSNWYASPGIHITNALGYLITERPWGDDTHDAIWYLDDDDQADEDRRKALFAGPDSLGAWSGGRMNLSRRSLLRKVAGSVARTLASLP